MFLIFWNRIGGVWIGRLCGRVLRRFLFFGDGYLWLFVGMLSVLRMVLVVLGMSGWVIIVNRMIRFRFVCMLIVVVLIFVLYFIYGLVCVRYLLLVV